MSQLVNLFKILNKTLLKTQMTIFPIISCMSYCELSTLFTQALKKSPIRVDPPSSVHYRVYSIVQLLTLEMQKMSLNTCLWFY